MGDHKIRVEMVGGQASGASISTNLTFDTRMGGAKIEKDEQRYQGQLQLMSVIYTNLRNVQAPTDGSVKPSRVEGFCKA
jgi:hypothetical protein